MNHTSTSYYDTFDDPIVFAGCLTSCFIFFLITMINTAGVPEDTTIPYESKYYDAFVELEHDTMTDDDKNQLINNYMKEFTDDDYIIIMNYCFRDEAFHYWGEYNIPFSILDSVAQLYSIENKCKSICVDYRAEIEKASEKLKENKTHQKECIKRNNQTTPFASFKKYNMKTNRATKNNSIIPEKCNHFRRKGTIDEWIISNGSSVKWISSINSETAKTYVRIKDADTILQPITYAEWKLKENINSL